MRRGWRGRCGWRCGRTGGLQLPARLGRPQGPGGGAVRPVCLDPAGRRQARPRPRLRGARGSHAAHRADRRAGGGATAGHAGRGPGMGLEAAHRLRRGGPPAPCPGSSVPEDWPVCVLQEFIRWSDRRSTASTASPGGVRLERPSFPAGARPAPLGCPCPAPATRRRALPAEAERQARRALAATGLLASFGCVDLLPTPAGRWLVLEVGTDGLFNHVIRISSCLRSKPRSTAAWRRPSGPAAGRRRGAASGGRLMPTSNADRGLYSGRDPGAAG